MKSVYNFTINEYIDYFSSIGESKYRSKQMFNAIYKNSIKSFEEITTIKKDLRETIKKDLHFSSLKIIDVLESNKTIKFLFELHDGNVIETVLMRQEYGNCVCITTQVGCNMGCKFCASGELSKLRNLDVFEMVLQIIEVQNWLEERISHVVVMGIGEPFDNFENVMNFIEIINSDLGLGIGSRHITVSTSGIAPKIIEFANRNKQVNLAISLHSTFDNIRNEIMPINIKYNLDELKKALFYYCDNTSRRLTIEYVLINNINDSIEDARNLIKYLRGLHYYINLIPLNAVNSEYNRSSDENIKSFFDYLSKGGINVRLRQEFGETINAACGQLRSIRKEK
ncbi:MAG: 23S rRNA (adenine(2503)-C(2))-methyltransferase RlmN [Bacilli bacterium]